jgi:hypothetical protein
MLRVSFRSLASSFTAALFGFASEETSKPAILCHHFLSFDLNSAVKRSVFGIQSFAVLSLSFEY